MSGSSFKPGNKSGGLFGGFGDLLRQVDVDLGRRAGCQGDLGSRLDKRREDEVATAVQMRRLVRRASHLCISI